MVADTVAMVLMWRCYCSCLQSTWRWGGLLTSITPKQMCIFRFGLKTSASRSINIRLNQPHLHLHSGLAALTTLAARQTSKTLDLSCCARVSALVFRAGIPGSPRLLSCKQKQNPTVASCMFCVGRHGEDSSEYQLQVKYSKIIV